MKRLVIIGAGGLGREVLQYIIDINKYIININKNSVDKHTVHVDKCMFHKNTYEDIELAEADEFEEMFDIVGFLDDNYEKSGMVYRGTKIFGSIEQIFDAYKFNPKSELYAICAIANPKVKEYVLSRFSNGELEFINIIHPTAYVGETVSLGKGIIIGPNCVLTSDFI